MIRFLFRSLFVRVTVLFAAAYIFGIFFIAQNFLPDLLYTAADGHVFHYFRHPAFLVQAFWSFWPLDLLVYIVVRIGRFATSERS